MINYKYICYIFSIYIFWLFIHYISVYLYTWYCVPYGLIGFIKSALLVTAPHCIALRWCICVGANSLTTMIITLGTFLSVKLLKV